MNDHTRPPEHLRTEHARHSDADIEALRADMREMKGDMKEVKELLTLFNNTKGFIVTVKWLGFAVLGILAVSGAVAGALAAFRAWAKT